MNDCINKKYISKQVSKQIKKNELISDEMNGGIYKARPREIQFHFKTKKKKKKKEKPKCERDQQLVRFLVLFSVRFHFYPSTDSEVLDQVDVYHDVLLCK